ncbi:MAG: SusC/RagA family TonB-linked outer membrane protein [Cyclobacteriaceae bacterium]|nr:SusC/RagA family TonB-linked outer membrane protein [Cyclobacteriaceae bacterium]
MRKIVLMLMLVATYSITLAQERQVSGRVTAAEDGSAIPGVNVVVKGTTNGTITDSDGNYKISVPQSGGALVFSFVGLQTQEVLIGERSVVDVALSLDATQLGEVVVTGVSIGTPTKKLGFSIGKVSTELLESVPGIDPANALRAKVPGVRIVSPSGLPGSAPAIRVRGTNSIQGNQAPLIVVDGVVTTGTLADIDMQAVESIEILKGASAAALYGSLAGNGVVQIITKRGKGMRGGTRITFRNETGISQLFNKIDLANTHNFATINGSYRNPTSGVPNNPDPNDDILDNPYSTLYDQQEELFEERGFSTNFFSIESSSDKTNLLFSFENINQKGIVEGFPNYTRNNFRLNADHRINDKLNIRISSLYSRSLGPNAIEQGQGNNLFFGAFLAEPDVNLKLKDANGEYNPLINSASNGQNPFYVISKSEFNVNRERLLADINLDYSITDWLKLDAKLSQDMTRFDFRQYQKSPFQTANGNVTNGNLSYNTSRDRATYSQFRALFSKTFGQLKSGLVLSYIYEDYLLDGFNAGGSNFRVIETPTLGLLDPTTLFAGSFYRPTKGENLVSNLTLDYKDRYILDAVLRRDGFSLFGSNERYQIFYRVAAAYRLSEDFKLPGINEFKLRSSIGTAGQRPPWEAQYETFDNNLQKSVFGNKDLKPGFNTETEYGIDISFLDRFKFEATYATTIAKDQILLVPLSAAAGFQSQWQNAGTMKSNTIELGLSATLIEKGNFTWDINLNWDRVRQEVTKLNRAPYTRGQDFGAALNFFQIEEGIPFGTMYGNVLLTSVDQLTTNENGIVLNTTGNLTREDFTVNSDGYVVQKGTEFTANERVFYKVDNNGNRIVEAIGNGTPDFNLGISSNASWKNLSLYFIIDWQKGGDVYNYTKQLLYFNERHGDLDQSRRPEGQRHFTPYYSQQLYNAANPSSFFIEDASFVKIRELSLSYSLGKSIFEKLGKVGSYFHDARISLIGRNLFTFTNYTGFDPEVAVRNNAASPTNFKLDEFSYPNFRTYSLSIQVRF